MSSIQPLPQRLTGASIDFSPRVVHSSTVAASPAAATETVVCTVTLPDVVKVNYGVIVIGYGAFTMGTDGTSYNLKLRQTGTSGTTLKASGLIPLAAAVLGHASIVGFDASPSQPGQVYVLTATMTAASAASTFSAAELLAIVI